MQLVSIALATYNGAEFLESQLESLMEQDYQNIEVVICDDCSTDGTLEIVDKFSNYFPNRIRLYINSYNLGFVYNFEKAISLCNGAFIALCDQDDIWYPQKISRMVELIGNNQLISSDMHIINRFGESDRIGLNKYLIDYCLLGKKRTKKNIWMDGFGLGCSMMFTESFKKKALPFPRPTVWHDFWLASLAYSEKKIDFIDEKLIKHRIYSNSSSSFLDKKKLKKEDLYKIVNRVIFNERLNILSGLDREDRYYIESNSRMFVELLFNMANSKNDFVDIAEPAEYLFENVPYFQNLILEQADISLKECISKSIEHLIKMSELSKLKKNERYLIDEIFNKVKAILQDEYTSQTYSEIIDYLKEKYFNLDILSMTKTLEELVNINNNISKEIFRAILKILPCIKSIYYDLNRDNC